MNARFRLKSQYPALSHIDFPLPLGVCRVGRSSRCDLVMKDRSVSRIHAEITTTTEECTVRDLNSRNGTFIDKKRILAAQLRADQCMRFGSVAFLITCAVEMSAESSSDCPTSACGKKSSADLALARLSQAQRRVLASFLRGLREKQVAAHLHLSPATVHNHLQAIYQMLKVHSRAELLVKVLGKEGTGPTVT